MTDQNRSDPLEDGFLGDMSLWERADPGPAPLRPLEPVESKFPLGRTVMSSGVASWAAEDTEFLGFAIASLRLHAQGEWGEVYGEDRQENDEALRLGNLRLFSAYTHKRCPTVWIITEADRSVTTTLFPDEY